MSTQQVKFDPARRHDFELVAEVGDILSEEGLTRVKLGGIGNLTVEHRCGKEKQTEVSGELDAESAGKLFRLASQFDWNQRFPARRGLPDEAIVQWYLHDRRGETTTLKVWLRDAEKHEVMASVLAVLRKGVEQASHGKLYL